MIPPWPRVLLGNILSQGNTAVPVSQLGDKINLAGVYSFARGLFSRGEISPLSSTYKSFNRLVRDDFVISQPKAWEGALALVTAEFDGHFLSPVFPTFRADRQQLNPRFLDWYCKQQSVWEELQGKSKGMGARRETVSAAQFLSLEIPLPPLKEQQRIVERIDELSEQIREAKQLRHEATDQAKQLYMAHLNVALEPRCARWSRKTVGDVILTMDAGWSPQCNAMPATEDGWGVLKTTAIQWCEFRPNENKELPDFLVPRAELAIKKGDVLITRAGPRKRVGVVAAARHDEPKRIISDKIIRLRPDNSKIDARFLELSLSSPFSQEHLVQRKTGLADAQVNISQAILRQTPVAYPSLEMQLKIVAELEAIQTKITALNCLQTDSAIELNALLPAILDKAFKGKLS